MHEPQAQAHGTSSPESFDTETFGFPQKQLFNDWIERLPYNQNVYEQIHHLRLLEDEVKVLEKGIPGDSVKSRLRYFFRSTAGRVAAALILMLIAADVYFSFCISSSSPQKIIIEKSVTDTSAMTGYSIPALPAGMNGAHPGTSYK